MAPVIAFFAALFYDLIAVLYLKWSVQNKELRAAGAAGLLEIIRILSIYLILDGKIAALGLVSGAVVGTLIGNRLTKNSPGR